MDSTQTQVPQSTTPTMEGQEDSQRTKTRDDTILSVPEKPRNSDSPIIVFESESMELETGKTISAEKMKSIAENIQDLTKNPIKENMTRLMEFYKTTPLQHGKK